MDGGAVLAIDHDSRRAWAAVESDVGPVARLLRGVALIGHWPGVAASPKTIVDVHEPSGLARPLQRLALSTRGAFTGDAASSGRDVRLGLGGIASGDVSLSVPGTRAGRAGWPTSCCTAPLQVQDDAVDRQPARAS